MNFEWRPFTDLLAAIVDNRGKSCPVGDAGMPLIATNCVDPSNLYPSYDTTRYVSTETQRTWFRGHPLPGDILFVCKGSPGRTNWCPDPVDFCIAQDMVAVRADPKKVAPKYLFAALRSSFVQSQIANLHVGTMIPHFKKGDFGKLRIPVPSSQAQAEIGNFYFEISARIALLRETNATLEAIAQALFKSWFVDFDPVHAKQKGLAPAGMDDAKATLFPDNFEESTFGPAPMGWRNGAVGDFAQVNRGSVSPGGSRDTMFEHFSLPAFDSGQVPVRELGSEIKSNKTSMPRDAVLLSKLNPHIPRIWLPSEVGSFAICSTEFLVFTPVDGVSREFIYSLFVASPFQERLRQLVTGTSNSHQRVKPDSVLTIGVVVPPSPVIEAFTSVVRPLFERVALNRLNAQTLATLRDTLLPRLISGRLRLPEAEAALAET